jgi:RNA polymerase sigma-70 factor (ECF subfamily)
MSTPDPAEEFVFLLARHERMLRAYVYALVPHAQDSDDILQEAKVRMWRAFGQFQSGTNFAAWSRKVTFHQVLSYRKRRKRDRLDFSDEFINSVAGEQETSADHLEHREKALQVCITKLPDDQREVLHLRYSEGLSLEAMADKLKRTVAALYRQLSRVRHVLHECVTKSLTRLPDHDYPAA